MKIFDAHCDTIYKIDKENISLYENDHHCDIKKMRRFDSFAQFFAAFVEPEYMKNDAFTKADTMINKFYEEVSFNESYINICKSYDDIINAHKKNKIAALLTLEGASPLNGDIDNLYYFYNKGVRLITLTWNHKNELCCGEISASQYPKNERGLTSFGIEVVKKMNDMGIIIDTSHISDDGFYDVLEYSSKPFMASHSNSRHICDFPRNLTDDMIRIIGEAKGFIGINMCPDFIDINGNATIDKIIAHIEHIASIAGENHIGFGCDFDGIEATPEGINDVCDIHKIIDRLIKLNYSSTFIEKFTYRNLMSFVKNII